MDKKTLIGSGFTLLELLIAVAILGVITMIAIPSYNAYRDKANNAMAKSDISVIMQAIERYYIASGQYPPTINDIAGLPNHGNDPWGNAYVYLNIINGGNGIMGQVRKDHALNPINTYYDLYSLGKNGVTKTQITQNDSVDDIIVARDGQFVGLATDF